MKKVLLTMSMAVFVFGAATAQDKKMPRAIAKAPQATMAPAPQTAEAMPAKTGPADEMVFKTEVHDFGTVQEGPAADYEFEFKNNSKEPIVIDRVQASCGCTTPSYSKEPILPGKAGTIKASYNTQGRPGPFTKSITAYTNQGVKVLTIKGAVEKGPDGSVPENNSLIKTH